MVLVLLTCLPGDVPACARDALRRRGRDPVFTAILRVVARIVDGLGFGFRLGSACHDD